MQVDKLSSASSAVVGDNNGAATTSPPQPNATTLDTSNGTPVEPVSRPIEDVVSEIGIKLKVPQPGSYEHLLFCIFELNVEYHIRSPCFVFGDARFILLMGYYCSHRGCDTEAEERMVLHRRVSFLV